MTTAPLRLARRAGRSLAPGLALAIVLAACTSGATATASGPAGNPPAASTQPTTGPVGPGNSPTASLPPGGGDKFVVPQPGQLDVRPIAADSLAARVDGRHVVVTITYTSGVEPCSVLDTIAVERGQGSFAITLLEGHGPGNPICIMIARIVQTQVDLGELDPGTYTITDTMRGADPIQVVVG